MRKSIFVLLAILLAASLVLAACGGAEPAVEEPMAEEVTEEPAAEPAEEVAAEPAAEEAMGDKVQIRWFVGLGTGTDPEQVAIQEEVVADYNASQDAVELVLEVVPFDAAKDTLSTQIASGNGPDIIGPVGMGGSNAYYGQFLDLAPYIESSGFDTSIFNPALIEFYQTEAGQVGLPFAVFPGAMYFIPEMFDEAGLAYPPQTYGEQYELDGEMVDWNWDTITKVAKLLTVDINGLNSTEEGFDKTQIVQVGYEPQWQSTESIGTFIGGAAPLYDGEEGSYVSTIPDSWKEAWKWWHDGMWGDEPFIATGSLAGAPEFGNGNPFNSGKAAMGLTQTWYTCCMAELRDAGFEFQVGIQPMLPDGTVQGRLDADTFRIWSGTSHPEEAFDAMSYLITTGGDKLLPIYGAMPAIAEKTDAFFEVKSDEYPFVTDESWNVFVQGLAYPDTPSSEQYVPNWIEGSARFATFGDLLRNTEDVDLDAEIAKLQEDLTIIYNK
ncbi:MAG: sugar ABC transporter substrate-binding protein [Chloroflexi bacterium]|nr:MAG: sugar ABC transporter substrate-binding protein [Chloroflexota bacterium]